MNYYELLGVSPTASDDEIRQAYRKQMRRFHPDRNKGQEEYATEKSRQIIEAYETIRTAELRAEYDAGLLLHDDGDSWIRTEAKRRRAEAQAEPVPVKRTSLVMPAIIIGIFVLLLVTGAGMNRKNLEPTTELIGSWAFDECICYYTGTATESDKEYKDYDPGATVNVKDDRTFELYAKGKEAHGTWDIDEEAAEKGYDVIRLDYYDEYENSPLVRYFGGALQLNSEDPKSMFCGFALDEDTDCYLWFYRTE